MNKVITINLNGRAYQLEEAGYEKLRTYLDQAAAKLHDDPDKDEIMADFEQAIADKCNAYLSSHKNTVTTSEMEEIIQKMGAVDTGHKDAEHGAAAGSSTEHTSAGSPKRLYQIRQGAWISGVCVGLAAYFNIDVALVRVIFLVFSGITHGFGLLLYIILMIVMPVARTEEELAAAHGAKPFNAHDFIEQAKARAAEFRKEFGDRPPMPETPGHDAGRSEWQKWKVEMKHWKQQWKADMRHERMNRRAHRDDWNNSPLVNAGTGFFRFVIGLILAVIFALWALSLWTVLKYGTILGYGVMAGHPLWISIVFVCALYYVISMPFRFLMKNARPWQWRRYSFFNDVVESLFFILAIYLLIYTGRALFPVVNEALGVVTGYVRSVLK